MASSSYSSQSSTGSNTNWKLVEEFNAIDELDHFLHTQFYKSSTYQTNTKIQCVFCFDPNDVHKMTQRYGQCTYNTSTTNEKGETIKVECPVKYKVNECLIKIDDRKMSNIYKSDNGYIHEHDIYHENDKIDPKIKMVIHQILDQNPQIKPKQIRVLLNTNLEKYPSLKNSTVPELKVI